MERKAGAVAFYESLCREVDSAFRKGTARLDVTVQWVCAFTAKTAGKHYAATQKSLRQRRFCMDFCL